MSRLVGFIVFFAIAVCILWLVHYYLWARLVRDPGWPASVQQLGSVLFVVLAVGLPLGIVLARFFDGAAKPLLWVLYTWMGLMFLLLMVLGATDFVRLVTTLGQRVLATAGAATQAPPPDPERRLFFARLGATVALTTSVGAAGYGMRVALGPPRLKRLRIELSRLPVAMNGIRLVQLTDLHIGSLLDGHWLSDVVERTNALGPDVVAITGDLVDGSVHALREAIAAVGELRARYGVYFVTGNHEYYSGVEAWTRELERLGIRVLCNERVRIGDGESSFDLAGVNDASATRFGERYAPDLGRALEGYDAARELVLLAHQPKAVLEASSRQVGLQLSGHTHGGQIWPWGYVVRLTQPYVVGLARHGDTQIYVSPGTGFWGPPMRVGAPSEITLIELTSMARNA